MEKLKYYWKQLVNYWNCEWDIFCFVDSVEGCGNPKWYVDNKIKEIKNKYNL